MEKNFRLESILNLREHLLNRERDKLINLKSIKEELIYRKDSINKTIEENINELEIFKNRGKFEFITIYENFLNNLSLKIVEIDKYLIKVDGEIDKQMKIVFEARKDKKIMEKLKENHKDSYEKLEKYLEEKFIDEINTIKYNDKKN